MAAFKGGLVFISEDAKSRCALVHCVFRRSFQTVLVKPYSHMVPFGTSGVPGWRSGAEPDKLLGPTSVGEGERGPSGPRTGNSSGVRPGNSSGLGDGPGSRIGGGTSGCGLPGGLSRGGSDGCPGLIGGSSCGSIGISLFPAPAYPSPQRHGGDKVPWRIMLISGAQFFGAVIVASAACCCGFFRSRRNRAGACRQCSPQAIRRATDARSPPHAARAMAGRA